MIGSTATRFNTDAANRQSRHYERTTHPKRDRLNTYPFSPESHKLTVSGSGDCLGSGDVFGRRMHNDNNEY
jgi:hypothetical protein